jgi:hypothetical protein
VHHMFRTCQSVVAFRFEPWASALYVVALCVGLSGCSYFASPGTYIETEGVATRAVWETAGPARLAARDTARAHARQQMWDAVLATYVDLDSGHWQGTEPGGSNAAPVEYLVMLDKVFESHLRALIGATRATEVVDTPEGDVTVCLRVDRLEIVRLIAEALVRLRVEGRLAS